MARKPARRKSSIAAETKRALAAAKKQLAAAQKRIRALEREQKAQRRENAKYKAKGLAYWKRVAKGLKSGKTRQQARGHRAKEHVTRAEHARAEGKLTSAERQRIKRFAEQQSRRTYNIATGKRDVSPEEFYAQMSGFAEQRGFSDLVEYMAASRTLHKQYKANNSRNLFGNIDAFKASEPDAYDIRWMFYH